MWDVGFASNDVLHGEGNDFDYEIAKLLLDIGAVTINVSEPYIYSSGVKSPIYCDNRLIISFPVERRTITRYFVELLGKQVGAEDFDTLGGVATSGIPFASWLADYFDKPLIYVRESSKAHGKMQQIEGFLEPGKRVIVIEDLITTGSSALATIRAIREAGGVVSYCAAIFTYESKAALEAFQGAGIQLLTLCRISRLLTVARDLGKISHEEKAEVEKWLHTFFGD